MKKTLREIAELINGKIICGDEGLEIYEATSIDTARDKSITFALPAYVQKAAESAAGAVILPMEIGEFSKPAICVDNPKEAFAKLAYLYAPKVELDLGLHPLACVHPTATIGKNASIMPFAVVDKDAVIGDNVVLYPHTYVGQGVVIGDDCVLHAGSSVREFCVLGNRVLLMNGAVVGGDGFGFTTNAGKHTKVPQVGNVIIGHDVELGCNTCVDRATTYKTSTVVNSGTKVDNLVHIAHNDIIGENCFIIAQVGISGSVKIGNNCTIAGQVGTAGHIEIGDNVVVAARGGVVNNLAPNAAYAGFPAIPHREWLKKEAHKSRLPELADKVKKMEKQLQELLKGNQDK